MGDSKRRQQFKAKVEQRQVNKNNWKPTKSQPFKVNLKSKNINNVNRKLDDKHKQSGHMRSASTIARIDMYSKKMSREQQISSFKEPHETKKIAPDRRYFMNTRTISQGKLDEFRNVFDTAKEDPYSVVIKKSKTPLSLFNDTGETKGDRSAIKKFLAFESFAQSFHSKSTKKTMAKGLAESISDVANKSEDLLSNYSFDKDKDICTTNHRSKARGVGRRPVETDSYAPMDVIMSKGTSKRIWGELYKVVDSSDIIVYVIDARDPMGTRCRALENHIKADKPNKHQILVLNKVDLVPNYITEKWIKLLSKEFPTVGYCTSMAKGFGRETLINLIRQYSKMMKEHRNISIGFVGYPNAGKSSLINSLRNKIVCKVAPVPGMTKVWQYISLTDRVHLIDCPGVVPSDPNDEVDLVLKGVIRAEKLEDPDCYIAPILQRIPADTLRKRYRLPKETTWIEDDAMDFLETLGLKLGKLKKGGDVDFNIVARHVIHDFQRGKLPYFIPPPSLVDQEQDVDQGQDVDQELN
eukprot:GHVH01012169.1.p1 GENE.GHVH01012169.1~~GHVH01012169.1.p1  ORF type:complete len:524 (+),score=81.81 GHVH01012169.1:56-1627(+)